MFIRSLAVIVVIIAMLPLSLPTAMAAKNAWPTCENFLSQGDAQAAFDADTSDPLKLVSKSSNGVPCQGNAAFGTQPLVSCDALASDPDAQAALQGLLDHTSAGGDPYGLDPDGNGTACDQATGTGGDPETLDAPQSATPQDTATPTDTTNQPDTGKAKKAKNGGNATGTDTTTPATSTPSGTNSSSTPPTVTGGNDVIVTTSTGASESGESLDARLEARFAELEAQFAAFSGHDDTTSNSGPSSPVVVSTAPPATTSGASSSVPSTSSSTSSTGTGTTTALHRGHHGHGKGHGKHHKGHKNGKHHNKKGHKHH